MIPLLPPRKAEILLRNGPHRPVRFSPSNERNQHRHGSPVFLIRTVFAHEVPFLELDCQQDVSGRRYRKQQVGERHVWRHPEREKPADVQRMTYEFVWSRRFECHRSIWPAYQVKPYLSQTEQIEMIDQEGGQQNKSPAESEQRKDRRPHDRIFHGPDHAASIT